LLLQLTDFSHRSLACILPFSKLKSILGFSTMARPWTIPGDTCRRAATLVLMWSGCWVSSGLAKTVFEALSRSDVVCA
jgi:hypothetical protein